MLITETVIKAQLGQQAHVATRLKALFSQLFGIGLDEIDVHTSFLEMGADSLSLLRVSQTLQDKFGIKIPFRLLLEELSTIDELAAHIARENPIEPQPQEPSTSGPAEISQLSSALSPDLVPGNRVSDSPGSQASADFRTMQTPDTILPVASRDESPADGSTLERIFSQQMRLLSEQLKQQTGIMSLQLDLLQGSQPSVATAASSVRAIGHEAAPLEIALPIESYRPAAPMSASGGVSEANVEPDKSAKNDSFDTETFVAYHPVKKEKQRGLTLQQQEHLDRLIERVTTRTKESKRLTQAYRPFLADGRTSAGFRQTWKEMCYPLVIDRGLGSRVYDVDDNEYVDLTMGFGALLFGHSPPFLVSALQEAVTQGVRLGGQSHIVGQTAQLICELTGVERVAFCNSGTEAVMSALRLARTVTGRTRIALFEGSYHGTFDGVMVKPGDSEAAGTFKAMPLAPGVPLHMIENVLLLGYDDTASLEVIRAHAHELAAVLIEPPRSRHPDVQPRAFLHELRKITEAAGVALIFDEVVTGFRFHPGGVQALFGVQADLVAYGKALGGGVPVAAVGGKAKFMDATDGGMWSYGDASYPRAETTFFAGTYFKNPLVVAAVWACLNHIKNSGPQLYEELNNRTARLARTLNDYFEQAQVPMRVTHLGSLMRFLYPRELKLMELFYYHLLAKGIYICETRNCFLSTAHTDEDVAKIVKAVKETIAEMREGGILPNSDSDSPDDGGPANYNLKDPFGNLATSFSTASTASSAQMATGPVVEETMSVRSIPLTEGQKQLWFLAQQGADVSVAYNLSMTLQMRGPFDLIAMRRSLQTVVDNHEALRITFSPEGDRQHIASFLGLEVPFIDISNPRAAEPDAGVNAWLDAEAKQPFELATGPLLRATVLRLAEDYHLLVLTTHHIVTDGWSLGVLIRELSAHYTAACERVACVLPPSVQFSEYVAQEIKQGGVSGSGSPQDYWLAQFAAAVPPLDLPTDYKRPIVQTYTGARAQMTIEAALCNRLERFSAQNNSTLFMVLLAAFNLLLHRLSGQDDIVVGIPAAGQASLGSSLIGYCVNVLPVRSRLTERPTFKSHLASVKKSLLDAYDNQYYPFSSLVKKLKLPRDPSRSPLVTVMFNLDRVAAKTQFFGLEVELLQNPTGSAQFEIDLNITHTESRLDLECDFNTSLFSAQTIERWLGHLRSLLVGIVENEGNDVFELPLLSDAERRQSLLLWNDTKTDIPQGESFQQLFERQVERSPDAVAVVCGNQSLTYVELNRRANHLARVLLNLGAGPERIVALLAERSIDLLVSILAVFKTGAAYLPLDPLHPPHRIAQVLAESGVALALATRQFSTAIAQVLDKLPAKVGPKFLIFEELGELPEAEENLPSLYLPDALAYVIYTSGSTGVPKGAMVVQRGMLNHLFAKITDLQITHQDAIAQNASQCFDISVWQFLAALLVGGRVHILNDEIAFDSLRVLEETSRKEISILETVPSLLRAILDDESRPRLGGLDLSALRLVVVTGEALPPEVCNRWLDRYTQIPLLNAYGPTECSDDVAHHLIKEKLASDVATVPIGKPLANTQLYIVDEFLEPLPIGVGGELQVGGAGVGRGYLGRPELTAEKFIPDRFSQEPGGRVYRTGDRARFMGDGSIEFLGRIDNQVKVRGHRIELGEIEAALERHAMVRQAVALAREDWPGEKRLVAYLIVAAGTEVTVSEWRRYLQELLPEYMVPSAFVSLTELPLTPNGKVDRRALPAPEQSRPDLERAYVGARTPVEESLCAIWREVLKVERVGVNDNFFELGGDSILTIQVIARARKAGLEINPVALFQFQNIAELAEVATNLDETKECLEIVAGAALPHDYLSGLNRGTLERMSLSPAQVEDAYPLSSTQQGMLFHHLYAPGSTAYFEQVSWSLHGQLDVSALWRAWEMAIEEHPILRTAFVWKGLDEPLQIVRRSADRSFAQHDWRELPSREQPGCLDSYLQEDRDRGFDLTAPPMRFSLIRLGDYTHQFIWSYHHILLDGWAVMLVLKEVFRIYDALRQGTQPVPLPGRPYRDYIFWQRKQDLSGAEAFWRRTLEGFRAPTPLGVDRPLGVRASKAEEFGDRQLLLSAAATNGLKTMARQNHLTMSTLILGAWGLLLSRYSGQDDVVFGTVVSGRPPELEGVEEMIGLFINTLPTRVQVRPEATLLEWLKQLQAHQAEARQYEYSPLVQVQGWSDVPRGLPLFESIVAFENYPINSSLAAQPGSLESHNVRALERVNYPLFIVVGPGTDLSISIYFDNRRFDSATIERMHGHLQTLLERIVEDPGQRLADLGIMNEHERRRLLFEWNDTRTAYPSEACAHQLFEQQAVRTPNAIALAFEGQELSYGELDKRANQLSRRLRGLGVGPESLVGVYMERSLEMVIALLGVLKAGGAYVPLDPRYPHERIAYMLKDAQVCVLLTQNNLLDSLPAEMCAHILCLDRDAADIARASSQAAENEVVANNLAYVIYTSGSTGMPKGVEIPHRAVVNFLYAMREQVGINSSDTLLAVTSLSFDIAALEIFLPLATGAKVEFVSRRDASDGARLYELLRESHASFMQATPTTWELLLNAGWRNNFGLKALCGGEAMSAGLAARLLEGKDGHVWNLYGPTETTIWSTAQKIENDGRPITIGHPLANTQLYIVDEFLEPLPIGVGGELQVGGAGVGRGYLGRPELTAEKFIPDRFSQEPGGRVYRTGDRARFMGDGSIEFLGRIDNQVKVRGHRIELGEIEAALERHAMVRQAVALAREDWPGEKRLVAYLIVAAGTEVTVSEWRRYLQELLPEYMVPSAFVSLTELPLTPNGKVDRRALPAPEQSRPDLERAYVGARTPVEESLCAIWREVLKVERVGVNDNFFELGGDSILTIQVIARARKAGMRLSPAELFAHPTIAELSEIAGSFAGTDNQPEAVTGEVPLTPIQHWFFEQNLPEPDHFNQAALLEVPAQLDAALIEGAVAELFIRHDALRLRFINEDGRWKQTVGAVGGKALFSAHDLSALPTSEQPGAIERLAGEIQKQLKLSEGPLARIALMKLGEDKSSRLLIVIHHLAVDITSWRILLEDFRAVCEQLGVQEKVELPAQTTSFALWSQQLSRFALSAELSGESEYWRHALDQKTARLPLDFEGENTEDSSGVVLSTFSSEETWSLLCDTPKAFRTLPSEVLLTAMAQAFAEWNGEKALLVEMEGHGRESISEAVDLSRTVGWFTSLYPVRLDIEEAADSVAALKLIKEQVRSVPRGGIGFGLLKYLNPESEIAKLLRAAPRAEVSFNYVGAQEEAGARNENSVHQAAEKHGRVNCERGVRPYLLMVTAQVTREKLTVQYGYSKNLHRQQTIERLAELFEKNFRSLISLCQRADATLYTPSDFPNANLNQVDLDDFIASIGAK
jgi:amino acid adenylation domain-containing protein/non-ribosomal peptide synthase protein (TIGR01720 family)